MRAEREKFNNVVKRENSDDFFGDGDCLTVSC